MKEFAERMGHGAHLASAAGSVEKRACVFSTWLRIARRKGDVACLALYSDGGTFWASFCTGLREDGALSASCRLFSGGPV